MSAGVVWREPADVCAECLLLAVRDGVQHVTEPPYGRATQVDARNLAAMVRGGYVGELRPSWGGAVLHPQAVTVVAGTALCAHHGAYAHGRAMGYAL